MSFDPYAVLGLARTATPEDIKRAFRAASMAAHPDKGGDAATFERVKRACDVLSDPARRARYDETGHVGEERPGTGDEAALGFISGMLASILGGDADPFGVDLVQAMGEAVDAEIATLEKKRRVMERARTRARRMAGRFSLRKLAAGEGAADGRRKDQGGENLLERMIEHHKVRIEREVKVIEKNLATTRRAREILAHYAFTADEPPELHVFGGLHSAASTNSASANSAAPGMGGFTWTLNR